MASEDVSPEAPRPLNCDKAHVELNWYSVLSIDECLRITSE